MRGLLALVVVVVAVFASWKFFGNADGIEEPAEAQAKRAEEGAGEKPDGSASALGHPTPQGQGGTADSGELTQRVRDAAAQLARGTASTADVEATARAAADSGEPSLRALAAALEGAAGGDPVGRWSGLSDLLKARLLDGSDREALGEQLAVAARKALTSDELSLRVKVEPGDSLAKIRQRVKGSEKLAVTEGLLKWVNGLDSATIYPNQILRIPKDPLRIEVSKQEYELRLLLGDRLIKEFAVGIGKDDKTPVDDFVVNTRLIKAPWKNPLTGKLIHYGEEGYAIGTRWIGFAKEGAPTGLGIHGTDEPDSIGKAESLGCIRMRNEEVEKLFELVPEGAHVSIRAGW